MPIDGYEGHTLAMAIDATDSGQDRTNSDSELPLDMEFKPGNYPRTAQHLAYEVLRRSIMSGLLAPNTRLGQNQIARQLSISSTPVREALRRLAGDELVRIDAHRGAVVSGLDRTELIEIYELRLLLEPLATRKAALNIDADQIDTAERLCDQMDEISDPENWAEANREFHAYLAESANSPNLVRILQGLRDRSALYVQWSIIANPDTPTRANEEHRQIINACRNRNADTAAAIEEQHLRATLQSIIEIASTPSP